MNLEVGTLIGGSCGGGCGRRAAAATAAVVVSNNIYSSTWSWWEFVTVYNFIMRLLTTKVTQVTPASSV